MFKIIRVQLMKLLAKLALKKYISVVIWVVHDPLTLAQVRSSRELSIVSVVNISMLIISTIWFMLDLSVSCVPRPCLYMLGSSSQPKCFACVPRPCLYMLGSSTPVVFERLNKTPDHHVMFWNSELSQRCTVGENTISSWNFSERSPHNATVVLSKIRCIKRINITYNS